MFDIISRATTIIGDNWLYCKRYVLIDRFFKYLFLFTCSAVLNKDFLAKKNKEIPQTARIIS